MTSGPILILDTSALNYVADDSSSEVIIQGLRSGFHVRLPFTCVSEIIATRSNQRRRKLLELCRKLLASGDCIEPHHEIIRRTVEAFEGADHFDWRGVNVRFPAAEQEIARNPNLDDDLAQQEREEGRANNEVFESVYADARSEFDELAGRGAQMPGSATELVSRLQQGEAYWKTARNLYDRVAKRPADETTIRRFHDECAPFRALMNAIFAALYDRCVRRQNAGPSARTGRNDTFMATYLPYCHRFVTNDEGQLRCFRDVVSIAGLPVSIRSYEDFCSGLFGIRLSTN